MHSKYVLMDTIQFHNKDKMLLVMHVQLLTSKLLAITKIMLQAVNKDIAQLTEFANLAQLTQFHA